MDFLRSVLHALWLLVTRAIAFAGLPLAFRLAARWGGWPAGALAVVGIALVPRWLSLSLDGHLEPVVLTLLLAGAELHVRRHRLGALVLLVLGGLAREEVWPLAGA